ncbi:hypothetical protein BJ741DRAFT_111403 [Chytriomyces cf. hyalinus JEL632]|nr:hypothetical protein BJ741DRAFT_111403 [Chytriomyces cf. hyalinus JEL632]
MADSPNNNEDGTDFIHFPSYDNWRYWQGTGATIDTYHDALHRHNDEIKFKRQYPEDAFAVFKYLAHLGHAAGMLSYGVSIMFGQGTAVDRNGGYAWVEKSATLGFAKAQRQLTVYLSKGIGCERSGTEALRWAQAAIDQGFVDAHSIVGAMYLKGDGVPVNHAKGSQHFYQGIKAGSIECISQVGRLYQTGTLVQKDIKKAVEFYEKAVSVDSALACYYLGDVYEAGDNENGIPKDPTKAAAYYNQSILLDNDSSAAMQSLAYLYDNGIGVEQSDKLALQYYLDAAKFDEANALYFLGLKYANGKGVEQDYTKAIEFYERAIKQNSPAAMSNLGNLLSEGKGCAKDLVRSADLYQQSAACGDAVGAFYCGIVFQYGQGVPVNLFKAVHYYRMSVRLKFDYSNEQLGPNSSISHDLYQAAQDLQTEKKDKEALDHFYAAAVLGHAAAITSVASMYRDAAGLGSVFYEKEMRYFQPPEAPDTTLSVTPNELLLQIFQWLHPKECILLRPVSRRIWTLFEDDSAARHLFKFNFSLMPPHEASRQLWFDQMLVHGPRAFQTSYVEMIVNASVDQQHSSIK